LSIPFPVLCPDSSHLVIPILIRRTRLPIDVCLDIHLTIFVAFVTYWEDFLRMVVVGAISLFASCCCNVLGHIRGSSRTLSQLLVLVSLVLLGQKGLFNA
jgi:hypothetical protein